MGVTDRKAACTEPASVESRPLLGSRQMSVLMTVDVTLFFRNYTSMPDPGIYSYRLWSRAKSPPPATSHGALWVGWSCQRQPFTHKTIRTGGGSVVVDFTWWGTKKGWGRGELRREKLKKSTKPTYHILSTNDTEKRKNSPSLCLSVSL